MSFRKIIFWGHLLSGLVIGILILNASITGAILAFEPQIVELAEKKIREVKPEAGALRMKPSELITKASAEKAGIPAMGITIKSDLSRSAVVNFGKEGGSLYLNPYTGAVLGKGSKVHDAMHKIEDWHRWLWARKPGKMLTGAASLIFFFMALTGLFLWWPRKWDKETRNNSLFFNSKATGKARDWNWHNVIGFWCAPVILMTSLTGVIMSYQWANDLLYRATGNEPPPVVAPQQPMAKGKNKTDKAKEIPVVDVDALWQRAENQQSNWVSINLRFPQKEKAPVIANIEEKAPFWVPAARSQLQLDAKTLEVVKWEPFSEQNLGKRLRTYARYFHTGEVGSLAGQLIVFVSAIGSLLLVWTGFALAWRGFKKWKLT